jgi:hypothetical protein
VRREGKGFEDFHLYSKRGLGRARFKGGGRKGELDGLF